MPLLTHVPPSPENNCQSDEGYDTSIHNPVKTLYYTLLTPEFQASQEFSLWSTSASGNWAIKRETTKDYLKGPEVALASGEVIWTESLAPKASKGYDLTHLF